MSDEIISALQKIMSRLDEVETKLSKPQLSPIPAAPIVTHSSINPLLEEISPVLSEPESWRPWKEGIVLLTRYCPGRLELSKTHSKSGQPVMLTAIVLQEGGGIQYEYTLMSEKQRLVTRGKEPMEELIDPCDLIEVKIPYKFGDKFFVTQMNENNVQGVRTSTVNIQSTARTVTIACIVANHIYIQSPTNGKVEGQRLDGIVDPIYKRY